MNASFGIDHPLLATKDIETLRSHLLSLGFNMTEIGKHPWGTSTSLAMFDGCLLEIMGIYDDTLIDEVPAGEFRFGRHVYEHLQHREGVALTALHSTDSEKDAAHAAGVGFEVAGHLEFGRDVTLPDGSTDRTKTTLALFPDKTYPRLSFFLCQQHRPELIYVPQWLEHPNQVSGIRAVNIVAPVQHHSVLTKKFDNLYTEYERIDGGFQYETANGFLRVLDAEVFKETIGPIPKDNQNETLPYIAGMDFVMSNPDALLHYLEKSDASYQATENGFTLNEPELTANTVIRFQKND